MTTLIGFYSGTGADNRGRTLADVLAWDDARLESVHDYIQWLFPLPEPSAFNPAAPILSDADIAAFHDRPDLHAALERSLVRMRAFYGLPNGRVRHWLTPGNHNMLRLSRMLRSLNLLGLEHEAISLLRDLEAVYKAGGSAAIGAETLAYWRQASK